MAELPEKDLKNDSSLEYGHTKTNDATLPAYTANEEIYDDGIETTKWDRMGITPNSFKKRTLADKSNQLNKTLKTRHLHMIAIGGSIGAGFFVGSGSALRTGGPASLLICFLIMGFVSPLLQKIQAGLTSHSRCCLMWSMLLENLL